MVLKCLALEKFFLVKTYGMLLTILRLSKIQTRMITNKDHPIFQRGHV